MCREIEKEYVKEESEIDRKRVLMCKEIEKECVCVESERERERERERQKRTVTG